MAVYLNCNAENGRPAARVGDSVSCPKHGTVTIVSGSPNTFHNDQPAARVGDKTSCGATITEGSSSVFINGKPAAYVGCATDHGGKITSGSPTIFIGAKPDGVTTASPEIHQNDPEHEYDHHFELIDQDGKPAKDYAYTIETSQGILDGNVCEQGKTAKVSTKEAEEVTLKDVYQTRIGIRT